MANRFILNETSYHGAGAIKSIVDEAKGRSFKKAFVCVHIPTIVDIYRHL